MKWPKSPYPYQKSKMSVTRSNRVEVFTVLTFHEEVDGPVIAYELDNNCDLSWDEYIAKKNKIDNFIATNVIHPDDADAIESELKSRLLANYFSWNDSHSDDMSKWSQVGLRKTYFDNLTHKSILKEYVGRYIKVCENEYEKEEFIQNYMKKNQGCDPREADLKFHQNFMKDHFDFRLMW